VNSIEDEHLIAYAAGNGHTACNECIPLVRTYTTYSYCLIQLGLKSVLHYLSAPLPQAYHMVHCR
jgi:hypothetical protein